MALIEVKVPDIGDFKDVAVIELLVQAGDTVTTRTPWGASVAARLRVSCASAAFDAGYRARPAAPNLPPVLPMLTIAPPRGRCGATCCANNAADTRFTLSVCNHSWRLEARPRSS